MSKNQNIRLLTSRNQREGWYIGRRNRLVTSVFEKQHKVKIRMEHVRSHGGKRRVEGMGAFVQRLDKNREAAQASARRNSCNFAELGIALTHPKDLK